MRHKTKWTVKWKSGVHEYYDTEEGARSCCLMYGGSAIYPPIYGD